MRVGVNYIPRKSWLHFWIDFDEESVREDIKKIKEVGSDHIRAHLIWSYFQPNANYMSETCMNNLRKFVKILEDEDLDFFLTLFTGFMSGFYFLPAWIKGGRSDSGVIVNDRSLIEAEKFYIKNIASVVSQSKNFLGFDLGNELSCLFPSEKTANDKWADEMFETCEKYAPDKLHNNGVDHKPYFDFRYFDLKNLTNKGAITPLHCWTEFTGARQKSGLLGTESINIASYMTEFAKAYCDDTDRKYWIQEFGVCNEWSKDENERLAFMEKTFDAFMHTDGLWGVTWWCSHDINEKFTGYDKMEYSMGLMDKDNNIKPEGEKFKSLSYKLKNNIHCQKSKCAIKISEETEQSHGWNTADKYMQCIKDGIRPAIILPKYENDKEYLKLRGIEKII